MHVVILAAGVGSRLGSPNPKPLTELGDKRTIMQHQLDAVQERFGRSMISIVVGFKKEMIMEAFPDVSFVYNPYFGDTNTSKSLLRALALTGPEPVLWMNGDVVFDSALLDLIHAPVRTGRSFVCVNTSNVGEEEVKYDLDGRGYIRELSKHVERPMGEAVGVNFVSSDDKSVLITRLQDCEPEDYFERGIELVIEKDGRDFAAIDVSSSLCVEIDFPEDLTRVNELLRAAR